METDDIREPNNFANRCVMYFLWWIAGLFSGYIWMMWVFGETVFKAVR